MFFRLFICSFVHSLIHLLCFSPSDLVWPGFRLCQLPSELSFSSAQISSRCLEMGIKASFVFTPAAEALSEWRCCCQRKAKSISEWLHCCQCNAKTLHCRGCCTRIEDFDSKHDVVIAIERVHHSYNGKVSDPFCFSQKHPWAVSLHIALTSKWMKLQSGGIQCRYWNYPLVLGSTSPWVHRF